MKVKQKKEKNTVAKKDFNSKYKNDGKKEKGKDNRNEGTEGVDKVSRSGIGFWKIVSLYNLNQ